MEITDRKFGKWDIREGRVVGSITIPFGNPSVSDPVYWVNVRENWKSLTRPIGFRDLDEALSAAIFLVGEFA